MTTRADSAASRPRSRRSLAHVPRSKMMSTLDKENSTAELRGTQPFANSSKSAMRDKKSRSKSLGPGGLDALQSSNGNRRQSTASFPLKSILKPTVPVSPVRNIPSFEETRRRTPARGKPQSHDGAMEGEVSEEHGKEGLLIDFEMTPNPPATTTGFDDNDDTANPFDTFNATSAIREEMAATKERDDKERKDRERQNILEKREARRKSMANRRVSFAPEATLHTWNVVEIPDDSTASSAANSTRRASAAANAQNQPAPPSPEKDDPSSPADSEFGFSPVRTQDLNQIRGGHQSSGNGDEGQHEMSSSPFSGSSVGSEDTGVQSMAGEEDDGNSSDSDDGFDAESTAMSMDDMTSRSGVSAHSDATSSSSSSSRLNEALRQAAQEAGTEIDEDGEMSMEIADQEITGAFQPWIKKGERKSFDWDDISVKHDQENMDPHQTTNPTAMPESDDYEEDEDLSMDVTNAVGRILGKSPGHRQSMARRRSTADESNFGDQTMEMTNVVGGIAQQHSPSKEFDNDDENDDEGMTMEFTSAVGQILGNRPSQPPNVDDDANSDQGTNSEDGMDMEMTGAIGGILQSGIDANDKAHAKMVMELETDSGQLNSSPFQDTVRQSPAKSPAKSPLAYQIAAVASESGSPSLESVPARTSRRSSSRRSSSAPKSPHQHQSPHTKALTPPKQSTPQAKPTTPSKTPPSSNVSFRSASPKKLFRKELRESADKRKSLRKSLFEHNAITGESTPLFKLQPRESRRSSGLGIDKEGLGSPRVAALLDKRQSLGESSPQFVPQEKPQSGVRFEDPVQMQEEEERDREEEELREDGHLPAAQSDKGVTPSLKDMISSLSPKKSRIGSRKSLHVGAARGILGKRPAELDFDEDEVENSPKRLRGHDVSPVKGVKLPAPTANYGNTRRSILSPVRRAASSSPLKGSTTPSQDSLAPKTSTSPLKNGVDALRIESDPQQPEEDAETPAEEPAVEVEPIELQDFLKMTNIHFMELTTTKRRHTTAPGSATKKLIRASGENLPKPGSITFEDCVAAGFCTVPMLELYQHSCRELKSYISEGRTVIRSIEAETFAENPPLFQEYVNAPPDIRLIMDNQFRNVKTHARLLSKATWYEWRMKLLEGLKEGLNRHVDDMKADDALLIEREELLNSNVPTLVEKHASLEEEASTLQQLVEEMENCDQDELRSTRGKLSDIDAEIAAKKQELERLQAEVQQKSNLIETGAEMRDEFLAQIQEAEQVTEKCRGWSAREINELKASVQRIERQTGWSIISASTPTEAPVGPLLKMAYRDQLQLKFFPGAFYSRNSGQDDKKNSPLELTSQKKANISPIASLVLDSLQRYLATVQQSTVAPKEVLGLISSAWDRTVGLENEARMLEFCGVTRLTLSKPEDGSLSLRARCTLLGNISTPSSKRKSLPKNNNTKRIDVDFMVRTSVDKPAADSNIGSLDFITEVLATKVYGFGTGNKSGLSDKELQSILGKGLSQKDSNTQLGNGVWCEAVRALTASVF